MRKIILLFVTLLISSAALSGSDIMKNPDIDASNKITSLIINNSSEIELMKSDIRVSSDIQGNTIVLINYKNRQTEISFSPHETSSIKLGNPDNKVIDKIRRSVNMLYTGNKGPGMKP